MLSGLVAGALGVLGGAKRWLTKETAIAIGVTACAIVLLIGGVMLFGAGKSSGGVRERLACFSGIAKSNAINQQRIDLRRAATDSAAAQERDRALAQLKTESDRAAELERMIAADKINPVVFERGMARSISR